MPTDHEMRELKTLVYEALSGLKDEMDDLQRYTGRKTAKILSRVMKLEELVMKLEELIKVNGGEKQ